jgi:hypothetical protein
LCSKFRDSGLRHNHALGFAKAGDAWRTYKSRVRVAQNANDPIREIAALSWVPDNLALGVEPVHVWNNLEKVSDEQITVWRRNAFARLCRDARNPKMPLGTRILYHRKVIEWMGNPGLHGDYFADQPAGEMWKTLWWSTHELGKFGDTQAGALNRLLAPTIADEPDAQPLQQVVLALSRLRPDAKGSLADLADVQFGLKSPENARSVIVKTALFRLARTPYAEPALGGTTPEAAAQAAVAAAPSIGHFLAAELLRTAAPAQSAEHWRRTLSEGELPLRMVAAWELAWPALVDGRDAEAGAILASLPSELQESTCLVALGRSLASGAGVPAVYPDPVDPGHVSIYLSRRTLAAVTAPGLPTRARQAAAFVLGSTLHGSIDNDLRFHFAVEQGWLDHAAILGQSQDLRVYRRRQQTDSLVRAAFGEAVQASPAERDLFIDRLAAGRCMGLIGIEFYSTIVTYTKQQQANLADALKEKSR